MQKEQDRYEQSLLLMHGKLKEKKERMYFSIIVLHTLLTVFPTEKQKEADRIAQERKQAGQRAEFLYVKFLLFLCNQIITVTIQGLRTEKCWRKRSLKKKRKVRKGKPRLTKYVQ